ncbi:MAG TPA: protein kinase [Pyrinomonadaceae bacterium]|nr:protein kinase [Pyrinomonadaceae bacterium]
MRGNPSLYLQGKVLEGAWAVGAPIPVGAQTVGGSGGNFSVAYEVVSQTGQKAFLKALDYSWAMQQKEVARVLQQMTAAYIFECDVLNKCNEQGLRRVVHAITTGTVMIDEPNAEGVVEYIIFELADGDVRNHLRFNEQFDIAWLFRSLREIAAGLSELHGSRIYHQDLKPSNVLVFDGKDSKLSDFGRSIYEGHSAPHYSLAFAGDPAYAPPDLAFGAVPSDTRQWRLSCDSYHLGSMLVFFFSGVGMTALLMKYLDPLLQPRINPYQGQWSGTYEEVLPYVRQAFDDAVIEFGQRITHSKLRETLTRIVRELCDPDPALRGHPKNRRSAGNSFSMERYITEFDLLRVRAEVGIYGN